MIVGIFSDIHGDIAALRRVVAGLEGADALYNLGDLVGRGDVNACMRLLAERGVISVAGGHDLDALAPPDTSGLEVVGDDGRVIADDFGLSPENKEALRQLPLVRRFEGEGGLYFFAHGMVIAPAHPGIMEVVNADNAGAFVQRFAPAGAKPPLAVFVGHSHIPKWFAVRGASVVRGEEVLRTAEIALVQDVTTLIDVGTVGTGAHALLDTTRRKVTIHGHT